MGTQSRRFRASKIVDFELFNLVSLLFLCLGFLIRPADYGNIFRYANSGSISWEQRRSEVITVANPGAVSLKQTTSEVIAIANSTSSNIFDGRCTVCGNYSSDSTDYGNTFQYADSEAFFLEQKTSEVFTFQLAQPAFGDFDGRYSVLENYAKEAVHLPLFGDRNLSRSYNFDYTRSFLRIPSFWSHAIVSRAITLSENSSWEKYALLYFGSTSGSLCAFPGREREGAVPLEYGPRRFFCESFEDDRYHLRLSSFNTTGDEFNNDITGRVYCEVGLLPNNDLELRSKVLSTILAGIIIFVIILTMAWRRIRNGILFKSNNQLDALTLEESDLDESYLADQILYENLLKEAVLVSEGSSGKVFKVRFLELDCAMKVFHPYARMDFRKESITLLNLSHPHVVKFFCSFRKSFIIMELMDEDLDSFITKIRERRIDYDMPLEVALDVMLQIAEGMTYLHDQGIAHQDLKSLNILLKLRGEFHAPDFQIIAKVADLGSARRFNPRYPEGFVLFPNMAIGTRLWRAPELFHPRGGFWTRIFGLNPRVLPKPLDIYGFAVICSELLTKQILFPDDEELPVAVFASKLRGGHRPALPFTGCPEGLLALIMDCWHRDPVLRPEFPEIRTRLIEVKSSWMSRGERLSES